ncbi:MAG TPA: Hsp33 family molecular chaperone HslO [Epulopiscium sp.]|nr:Hsp33 family molecular chaperone HslO [Candidatus Epulonipiscium sp.]
MKDYVVRGTDKSGNFRFFGSITKELVQTAATYHQTSPVATAALGRTMTATAMMSKMLKNDEDRMSVTIKGDGPIGGVIIEANAKGDIKGYPYNADVDLPLNAQGKLDVSKAFGNAVMTVMKDFGLKQPYIGQTILVSGEIAEDFTYYFATSEQTPSAVALGVLVDVDHSVKQSGGFIIQVLPEASDDAIDILEKKLKDFTSITTALEEGKTIEDIIQGLLGDVTFWAKEAIQFSCDCSMGQMERGLMSIGVQELEEIIEEDKGAEIICHFCNKHYDFEEKQLQNLLDEIKNN